ncbi:MAG: class I SAM-dependent RNA methyltransferase [Flavobacteriaceae bacterium]|nr:class I SAM-dependent RNA methyltransferase [Flavobacteriaceae bacterium]
MANNFKMLAKTLFGLEPILAKELKNLGAIKVTEGVRNVSFYGDIGFMYKANLALRTAIRILKPYKTFRIRDEHDLYNEIKKIHWEEFLFYDKTFAVNSTVISDNFTNSHYVSLKTKDAIVDYFRDKYKQRPSIDLDYPDLNINIHIQNENCTISFDSSGQSLHKRGYKLSTNIAPINEVLAAGMILLSGYDGTTDFIDPMCGSGTILIEAAMIALNIPANINRKKFAFENWEDFDADLFEKIKESLLKKIRETNCKITGYDKAPSAVQKTKENIENASLSEFIKVERQDFFDSEKHTEMKMILLFNPPYGERLKIDVKRFYSRVGDTLKQSYPNTDAWLITSDLEEGIKNVGLRTSRRIPLFNGKLECKFVKYEIYRGSKKANKQ